MTANPTLVHVRDVAAAVAAGNLARASQLATSAIRDGSRHPALFNARALWLQTQGQFPEALAEFQRALQMTPNDVTLLNAIGMCYVRCNMTAEGIAAFDAALAMVPENPATHFRKGWALQSAGDFEGAVHSYERAVEINPNYAEALAGLASAAARDGRRDVAEQNARKALQLDPNEPTATAALAIVENTAGNFQASEQLLHRALGDPRTAGHSRAVLLGFLGDALDGQDKCAEAFAAYSERAAESRKLHGPRMAGTPSPTRTMDMITDSLRATTMDQWKRQASIRDETAGPREHVFLLGFLRSGTTVLERALSMHPDVISLEERDTLDAIAREYMNPSAGLGPLANLAGLQLDEARAAYWRRVSELGVEPAGRVFIDKQPLNTFNLPLISKLFPDAKILFAIRDPRDVCFSCFRRHFEITRMTYEFLDLVDGARFYAAVMSLAELCREMLPLSIKEHRYEKMVGDLQVTVSAICEFIGIRWTDSMQDFSARAREQAIRSPSANQVRKPLYGDAVGEWRRYAEHLKPMLPILDPWVRHFGYDS